MNHDDTASHTAFERALALQPAGEGRYDVALDPVWRQGPGVVGGIQSALLLHAMTTEVADLTRRPRNLTVHFLSPARPGAAWCEVEIVRTGRSFTHVAARLLGASGVIATAMATFATARSDARGAGQPAPPQAPSWEALATSTHGDPAPVFTKLCTFKDCVGAPVYSEAAEAWLGGWGRLTQPEALSPAYFAFLADAWPPAMLACYAKMTPVASVALTLQFHAGAGGHGLPAGTPVLYEARATAMTEGYSEEHAHMWAPDGRLLATALQQVVVFG